MPRIFVGGLFDGVLSEDLKEKFSRFGDVKEVDISVKKDDDKNFSRIFATIEIDAPESAIQKCINVYNNTIWKTKYIRVSRAKDNIFEKKKKNLHLENNALPGSNHEFEKGNEAEINIKYPAETIKIEDVSFKECKRLKHGIKAEAEIITTDSKEKDSSREGPCMTQKETCQDLSEKVNLKIENEMQQGVPMFRGMSLPKIKINDRDEFSLRKQEDATIGGMIRPRKERKEDVIECQPRKTKDRNADKNIKPSRALSPIHNEKTLDYPTRIPFLQPDNVEKHRADNEKRLYSVKQRQKALKQQQNAIKNALAGVASSAKQNKKIVFGSDESETEEIDDSVDFKKDIIDGEDESNQFSSVEFEQEKLDLFGDNPHLGDDDLSSHFKVKQQFSGKRGRQLLELQGKINDERFRIDERFIDEREDDDDLPSEEVNDHFTKTDDDMTNEKLHDLDILRRIVNFSDVEKKGNQKKLPKMVRYDESQVDHLKYKITIEDEPKNENKRKRQKTQEPPEEIPEVDKNRFFKVDPALSAAIQKNDDNEPFSLLKLFGRVDNEKDDNSNIPVKPAEKTNESFSVPVKQLRNLEHGFFGPREYPKISKNNSNPLPNSEKRGQAFFFSPNDSRLLEAIDFFQKKNLNISQEKWKEIRSELHEKAKRGQKLLQTRRFKLRNKKPMNRYNNNTKQKNTSSKRIH